MSGSLERSRDPSMFTPARVRRGFRPLRATSGTPAGPPKSTTPPWAAERKPKTAGNPLSGRQESSLDKSVKV
jgi:hypothetical protein